MANISKRASVMAALSIFTAVSVQAQRPIVIDTSANPAPVVREFPNEAEVKIQIKKKANQTCKVEWTSKPAPKEDVNFGTFLAALAQVGTVAGAPACAGEIPPAPARLTQSAVIQTEIAAGKSQMDKVQGEIDKLDLQFRTYTDLARKLSTCQHPAGSPDLCEDAAAYKEARDTVVIELNAAGNAQLPTVGHLQSMMVNLRALLRIAESFQPREDEVEAYTKWLLAVNEHIGCLAARAEAAPTAVDNLKQKQAKLGDLLAKLSSLDVKTLDETKLPAFANRDVEGTINCSDYFTGNPVMRDVPFSLTYRGTPRVALTAGVLIPAAHNRKIGTSVQKTDNDFKTVVSELDRSRFLPVPFSFVHVRFWEAKSVPHPITLNGAVGAGVNPHYGSSQAEFFFGPSLGFGNLYLLVGGHVMRWQDPSGGYSIGTVVPNKDFPGVPVDRRFTVKWGFAISYRLPLPGGSK